LSKTQKPNIDIETILKKFNIDIPISEELADDNTLKIHIKSAFEKHATIINNNQIDDLDILKILGYPDTTKLQEKSIMNLLKVYIL